MGSQVPVETAIEQVVEVLRHEPAGLFTDIDGTISHVARVPSEATVGESPRASLRSLARNVQLLGVITGRSAADAAAMLDLDRTLIVGNHGYERLTEGERFIHPSALVSRASVSACAGIIESLVTSTPRLANAVVENKDLSASVHYRLVDDQDRTVELLRMLVQAVAELHDLQVTQGKLVFEIRPKAVVNKGTAIADIAHEAGLRGVVYLGDDVTDVDAFEALKTLRASGLATLSVGVVSTETHASVLNTADVLVDGVDGCLELLAGVAAALGVSID